MTIDELIEHYYDDLDGAITGFSGDTDTLDITFEYDESFQGEARVATIRCTDVRECTLHPGGVAELARPADHPLLWQHAQPHQILAFSSAPPNPFELLGRLYHAHEQLFGRWRFMMYWLLSTAPELVAFMASLTKEPTDAKAMVRFAQVIRVLHAVLALLLTCMFLLSLQKTFRFSRKVVGRSLHEI